MRLPKDWQEVAKLYPLVTFSLELSVAEIN